MTFPTGQVSSFRSDTDSSVHVQVETSSKDDITITTNLSASGAFYTLLQGKAHGPLKVGTKGRGGGGTPVEEDSPGSQQPQGLPKNRQALHLLLLCFTTHASLFQEVLSRSFSAILHCPVPLS